MEELQPQELEDLLRELEGESDAEESLPPEVEALLQDIQPGRRYLSQLDAARQLGEIDRSNRRVVQTLITTAETHPFAEVRRRAANALRAPAHQAVLQEHPDLAVRVDRALLQGSGAGKGADGGKQAASPADDQAKMQKEVRSWGLWWLGLGILSLILSGFSEPWGAVLLIAGLGSLVFREASMFVVYGTTIAWAAISNIFTGQISWIVFALFQLLIAFVVFRKYARYRDAEGALAGDPDQQRAGRAFPQIGCAFGALSLAGLATVFVLTVIVMGVSGSAEVPQLLLWLGGLATGLAVLGLAAALASLLSGYRHRLISILGLVACGLLLLLQIVFSLAGLGGNGAQTEAPATTFPSAASTPVPPTPAGVRQPGPGWTSYMTEGELEENIPPGSVVVNGFWADISVAQDGALWFVALGGGVLRHDGKSWIAYTENDGLASNVGLTSISGRGPLGGTGDMQWFSTSEGICRFDGETWTSYPESAGLASGPGPLAFGPDGALWYGTAMGATRFDGEHWITYTTTDGLASNYVLDIVVGADDAIWFATGGGVTRFDGDRWITYTTADGLAHDRVASVALAPDGALWFATGGGVSRFDGENWTTYTTSDGLVNNDVSAVAAADGVLWFGTKGGVSRFDGETWTSYTSAGGLVHDEVNALAVAPDGAVWFATEGGLSRYMPQETPMAAEDTILSPGP